MDINEATERLEEKTYELAKLISKLKNIKDEMEYIMNDMQWDGMYLSDFETALEKLAYVMSESTIYSLEDKYLKHDVNALEYELKSYKFTIQKEKKDNE